MIWAFNLIPSTLIVGILLCFGLLVNIEGCHKVMWLIRRRDFDVVILIANTGLVFLGLMLWYIALCFILYGLGIIK